MAREPLTEQQLRNAELLSYIINELPAEQRTRVCDRLGGMLDALLMLEKAETP